MNKKLKKEIKNVFEISEPKRKYEFINSLNYPMDSMLNSYFSQIGYISKSYWIYTSLIIIILIFGARCFVINEITYFISGIIPFFTLIGITEISRSSSNNMRELEMSCRFDLDKIIFMRLMIVGCSHFIIILINLIIFANQTEFGYLRYVIYSITPFILTVGLSIFTNNRIKSKDMKFVCVCITGFTSIGIFIISSSLLMVYNKEFIKAWIIILIFSGVLMYKEIKKLIKQTRELKWNLE